MGDSSLAQTALAAMQAAAAASAAGCGGTNTSPAEFLLETSFFVPSLYRFSFSFSFSFSFIFFLSFFPFFFLGGRGVRPPTLLSPQLSHRLRDNNIGGSASCCKQKTKAICAD